MNSADAIAHEVRMRCAMKLASCARTSSEMLDASLVPNTTGSLRKESKP
jgi:hypothetical protein